MTRLYLIVIFTLSINTLFGQKLKNEILCSSDTITITPYLMMKQVINIDSTKLEPYKAVLCSTRSAVGFRFELGYSRYYYGEKTKNWIGQHGGPNFNFILTVDKLNFGFRFKPWTITPNKEMDINGQTIPTIADLNSIKIDYYVGYSFDFEKLFSVEPYLGYNRSSFIVINEEELNQEFTFNKSGGLIAGVTLNRYFRIKNYNYISVFGTVGYAFVNYEKYNPDLDNGYFEWTLGIAYKGFFTKSFNKKVE